MLTFYCITLSLLADLSSLPKDRTDSMSSQKTTSTSVCMTPCNHPPSPFPTSEPYAPVRHFELPVLQEVESGSNTPLSGKDDVFDFEAQPSSIEGDTLADPSSSPTQTHYPVAAGTSPLLLPKAIPREELYRFVPLPLSKASTPNASTCSLPQNNDP